MTSSNEEFNDVPRHSAYGILGLSAVAIGLVALSGTVALPLATAGSIFGLMFVADTAINMALGESFKKSIGYATNDIADLFKALPKYLARDAKSLLKKVFGSKPAAAPPAIEKEPFGEPATVANMVKLAPLFKMGVAPEPEKLALQQPAPAVPVRNF